MRRPPLFWAMAGLGLLCCLFSLARRGAAEHRDRSVAYALTWDTLQALSSAGDASPEEWLGTLSAAGLVYLAAAEDQEPEARALAEAAGLGLGRIGTAARSGDAFLLSPAGTLPELGETVPLCLTENNARNGVDLSPDFDPLSYAGPAVKTLAVFPEYAAGFDPAAAHSEPENILFRAVTDRSVRLVVLAPLTDAEGETVADPAAYAAMLNNLTARLEARGLHAGGAFSCLDAPNRSPWLAAGMCLLPAALAVLFLCLFLPLRPLWENLLLALGAAVCLGGGMLRPELLLKLAALGSALLGGCFAGRLLAEFWSAPETLPPAKRDWLRFPLGLALLLLPALGGGLLVSSLLADREYLWGFAVFTGVKASQLLPALFTAVLLALGMRPWRDSLRSPRRRVSPVSLLLVLAAAAALALLVLRSGDTLLQAGALEQAFRNRLELLLRVRPRTKEFLVAFPALALYLPVCRLRRKAAALPLGVMAEVGAVSVVNTLCHLFTPLRVSLARIALGALLGLVLGLLALLALRLLAQRGGTRAAED